MYVCIGYTYVYVQDTTIHPSVLVYYIMQDFYHQELCMYLLGRGGKVPLKARKADQRALDANY